MANPRTPRRAWIEQGLRALADGGPETVRIEPLATALGVTKGGFYGYFPNRAALLQEMLDTWEREVTENVISQVESVAGSDARAKLRHLFAVVATVDHRAETGVALDLAVRDWARRDEGVAQRLRRIDHRQADYLRSLFGEFCVDEVDVEARCLIVRSVRIGEHLIPADPTRRSRIEVIDRVLGQQLI